MPHTKFVEIGQLDSREEDLKVFTIYGHGGNLGHVTVTIYTDFDFPFLPMLQTKIGFNWPRGFSGDV